MKRNKQEKIIKQIWNTSFSIVSVQPYKTVFLLFSHDAIYVYGEEKEIKKYNFEPIK